MIKLVYYIFLEVIFLLRTIFSGELDFMTAVVYIISALAVVFITMPIHEFAHGFAAVKLGDNTPRYQGRITLNPFAHIDYIGSLSILLFGYGWAKPVQVNMFNFKNPKRDMALTALAGPLSNIIVAFIATFLQLLIMVIVSFTNIVFLYYVALIFSFISQINISLAVFNLIPIPPLDVSRLLSALLPDRLYYKVMQYERIIFYVLLVLLFTDVLDKPLMFATDAIGNLIYALASLPFKLFLN